jgi:hypothetical protein
MIRALDRRLPPHCILLVSGAFSGFAQADFIQDSKASLEMRNMYINRDFRTGAQDAVDWGQGFTLRMNSGFTEGPVGFGMDAMAQLGLKLDSTPGNSNTGVLAVNSKGEPEDEWSELGLTAKARVSKTTLAMGTLQPTLPVVQYNDTRMLGGTFTGGMLTSDNELPGLVLNVGKITEANLRNSSSRDTLTYGYNKAESGDFNFAGGSYEVLKGLALSYYYGELENAYRQHYVGLTHKLPIADNVALRSDFRYFKNTEDGEARGGALDNHAAMGLLSLAVGPHTFAGAFQSIKGSGNMPFMSGSDPYMVNLITYNGFTLENTESWQARYDFNFAALGIPGLTFMSRYVKGTDVHTARTTDGKEWERNTDLMYVLQSGPLKGVNLRFRNVTYRSTNGMTTDIDENRFIVGYTLALW